MRRNVTWIVVGAIALLVALAVADALRPETSSRPATAPSLTTKAKPPTLVETLRSEAVSGFVLYSDRDCRLHSLLLPRMVDDVVHDEGGSDVFRCRFESLGGRIVSERAARAARDLAYQGGQVRSDDHVVLTHSDLAHAARRHPNIAFYARSIPLRIRVTALARVGTEVVVGLEISARYLEPQFLAAVFEGKKIRAIASNFGHPYRNFFVSADGVLAGSEDGTVFTRTGRTIDPPQNLPAGRAVAFSPDDRWLAWLNGTSFFLVGSPSDNGVAQIVRLPIAPRDLVWQPVTSGTSVGPPRNR